MKKKIIFSLLCLTFAVLLAVGVCAESINAKGAHNTITLASPYTHTTWSSLNEEYATVSSTGKVTGVAPGNAAIMATDQDDNTQFTLFLVTVNGPQSIRLDTTALKTFKAGDTLTKDSATGLKVYAVYGENDEVLVSDYTFDPASKTLAVGANTVSVKYGDLSSDLTVDIAAVTPKKIEIVSGYKDTYEVGETIKAGEDVKIKVTYSDNSTATLISGFDISPAGALKLTDSKMTVTFQGLTDEKTITVKENVKTTLTGFEIKSFTLKQTSYPVGYKFTTDDISQIIYTKNNSDYSIAQKDLANYTNTFEVQVLDENGAQKSSSTRRTLESTDVLVNKDGVEYFQMRLIISDGSDLVKASGSFRVTHKGVIFAYNGVEYAYYEDLGGALSATINPDEDNPFDLTRLTYSYPITLKLEANQPLSTFGANYRYQPMYDDLEIDLNGHSLSIATTLFSISSNNKKTITVTNTSSTNAKLYYYDRTVSSTEPAYTLTLAKGDKLVFTNENDADNLPGILVIRADAGDHGIIAKGASSTKEFTKDSVTHGTSVTFRIIPDTGYEIDTVTANGKDVTGSTSYKTEKVGTLTYGLYTVTVTENVTVKATFKAAKVEWQNPFTDVSKTASYYDAVKFVNSREPYLFKGISDTKFGPNNTMTRAMFVTVLGRLAEIDATAYSGNSFTDVDRNSPQHGYAAPYIEWASQNGLIVGYGDGTFGPNNEITHQQMYLIMMRYAAKFTNKSMNLSGVTITVTDRADIADWAEEGVRFATRYDILVASNNRIYPKATASRQELATLLMKFCANILGETVK